MRNKVQVLPFMNIVTIKSIAFPVPFLPTRANRRRAPQPNGGTLSQADLRRIVADMVG